MPSLKLNSGFCATPSSRNGINCNLCFLDKSEKILSKEYKLQLIPFLLEGVAQKPEFNLSDGMHPNDQGTIIIGNTLKKSILENL